MEFIKNNSRVIIIGLLVVALIVFLTIGLSGDNDDNNDNVNTSSNAVSETAQDDSSDTEESGETTDTATVNEALPQPTTDSQVIVEDNTLTISAETGDNQSEMARKIVATYLASESKDLQPGQLLFMETNIVKEAGSNDFIVVGSEVTVDKSKLAELTTQAENLSDSRIQAWETYL